ncbi:MAG: (d)CMP kinase [Chloroflexi bacterium]|nr:(d)CMP kinase [Chloroflexota bacterium]
MKAPRAIRIAIDGPVGAGKTSAGRLLAKRLGCRFLDTGLTYRAVALCALERKIDPGDSKALAALAATINISVAGRPDGESRILVDGKDVTSRLNSERVSDAASRVSAVPEVRTHMVEAQRRIAASESIVMVGRDIGTVVLPDADLKVFLTAGPETRARRRYEELAGRGETASYDEILESLRERDRRDMEREASPLRAAKGAHMLNTDALTLEEVASAIQNLAGRG